MEIEERRKNCAKNKKNVMNNSNAIAIQQKTKKGTVSIISDDVNFSPLHSVHFLFEKTRHVTGGQGL